MQADPRPPVSPRFTFGGSLRAAVLVVLVVVAGAAALVLFATEGSSAFVVGDAAELAATLETTGAPLFVEELGVFVARAPTEPVAYGDRRDLETQVATGFIALNATERGRPNERVTWCDEAEGFTSPVSASIFDRYGRKTGGPAPLGIGQLRPAVRSDGMLVVYEDGRIPGPAIDVRHDPVGYTGGCDLEFPGTAVLTP